jgi:hypothetical protein
LRERKEQKEEKREEKKERKKKGKGKKGGSRVLTSGDTEVNIAPIEAVAKNSTTIHTELAINAATTSPLRKPCLTMADRVMRTSSASSHQVISSGWSRRFSRRPINATLEEAVGGGLRRDVFVFVLNVFVFMSLVVLDVLDVLDTTLLDKTFSA